jgi:hypothetical protein
MRLWTRCTRPTLHGDPMPNKRFPWATWITIVVACTLACALAGAVYLFWYVRHLGPLAG